MARGKKGARRQKGNTGDGDRVDEYRSDVVDKADMHNERFEKYYKAQNILPEVEWEQFMEAMRSPLPTTFRVAGSRQAARLLNSTIKETHVPHLAGVVFEGEAVPPPAQISWYPEGLAWQFNVAKKVLRKSPEFKKFHSFLVFETEVGNISRQEAVSMLPPLFLEVVPHHRVMDMCAAPGSKTAQLLEALHANDTVTASSLPQGLLVANDSDHKRTHLLIHQSARLPSPALMVTNHDASIYPAIKIPSEQTTFASGTKARVAAKRQYQLLFDRILCDVPCSGDGTMRKNPGIWKHWQPMDGNGLHSLQLRILQRAMRMLKKGGRIVYSTCSMNPVENEAVIAAALKSIPGFELIDMSNHLPGLIHRPGMTTWRPTVDRSIVMNFASYEEYIQSLPEYQRKNAKMHPTHWPPSPEEAEALSLTRCMRLYPHLQDTGGFFVAVLRKTPPPEPAPRTANQPIGGKRQAGTVSTPEPLPAKKLKLEDSPGPLEAVAVESIHSNENEQDLPEEATDEIEQAMEEDASAETTPIPESATTATAAPSEFRQRVQGKNKADVSDPGFKENPFTFVATDDPLIQQLKSNLRLKPDFPSSNLLVRNPAGDPVRSLYMTNDIVRSIVEHNDYTRIRLVTCGTKVFTKQETPEAKREGGDGLFRALSEGLPVVLPFIDPEAVLGADLPCLKVFMEGYYPLCSSFPEPFKSMIEKKATGCYVVRFQPGQLGSVILSHDLVLPIWKSNVSLTLMIDKRAKSALSLRVFGEDITTAARTAAQKKNGETLTPADATPVQEDIRHNQ